MWQAAWCVKNLTVMEKLGASYNHGYKKRIATWPRHLIFWRGPIKRKNCDGSPLQLPRTVKYAFYCLRHNGGRLGREQYGRPIIWTKENKVFSLMKLKFNCVSQNDLFRGGGWAVTALPPATGASAKQCSFLNGLRGDVTLNFGNDTYEERNAMLNKKC